jgi:hypothetical protein
VTVLYRKKSYHSIAVPTVLATIARLSWRRCSSSEIEGIAVVAAIVHPSAFKQGKQIGVQQVEFVARTFTPR